MRACSSSARSASSRAGRSTSARPRSRGRSSTRSRSRSPGAAPTRSCSSPGRRSAARSRGRRRSSCSPRRRRCSSASGRSATRSSRSRRPENMREGSELSAGAARAPAAAAGAAAAAADGDGGALGRSASTRRTPPPRRPGMTLRASTRSSSTAPSCSTGTREARADGADRRDLRRRRGGADRRRGDRPDALARRPHGRDRRRAHQHAGRRGLLLADRGLGRGRDHVLRVSRRSTSGTRSTGVRLVFESGPGRRGERPRAARTSCSRTLDTDEGARALGELGIGCNPGIQRFTTQRRLRREDRRHGPSRDRELVLLDRRHERRARSTGTWSRTSAAAGGSTPTAGSSRRAAAGSRLERRRGPG